MWTFNDILMFLMTYLLAGALIIELLMFWSIKKRRDRGKPSPALATTVFQLTRLMSIMEKIGPLLSMLKLFTENNNKQSKFISNLVMMIMTDPRGIWIVPGISHDTPAWISRNILKNDSTPSKPHQMQLYLFHLYDWIVYLKFSFFKVPKRHFKMPNRCELCFDASRHLGQLPMDSARSNNSNAEMTSSHVTQCS